MNSPSRRRYERYDCEMVVWLRPWDSDDEFLPVDVENISSGGILVHSTFPLEYGTLLELQVSMLQMEEMVSVKAEVVHVRSSDEPDEFFLGLQFLETEGVNLTTFMAFLEAMFN